MIAISITVSHILLIICISATIYCIDYLHCEGALDTFPYINSESIVIAFLSKKKKKNQCNFIYEYLFVVSISTFMVVASATARNVGFFPFFLLWLTGQEEGGSNLDPWWEGWDRDALPTGHPYVPLGMQALA